MMTRQFRFLTLLTLLVTLCIFVGEGWGQALGQGGQSTGGGPAGGSGSLSGLTKGQRVIGTGATSIGVSGPYYYTEQLVGGDLSARVNACQALLTTGGTCDSQGETTPTTTAATILISNPGVLWIPPKGTITFGTGFQVTITGNHSSVVCPYLWDTVFNANNNGSAGTFILSGNDDHVIGCMAIGGLLTEQVGVEMQISGNDSSFEKNYMQYAGTFGIQETNCNNCVIALNRVDQAGYAAIFLNCTSGTCVNNKILYNEVNDSNTVDTGNGQLGIASSGGVGALRNTLVEGNFTKNLSSVASGNGTLGRTSCNGDITGATPLGVTLAGNGTTITGTVSGGVTAPNQLLLTSPVASQVQFTGITGGGLANATNFTIASTTATTFTITNANCNTSCTGTITFVVAGHGTAASGCSESIQVTDNPIDTLLVNNDVTNSWREGQVIAGTGNRIEGGHCESCGIISTGVGGFMWSNTSTPTSVMGDGYISNVTCTNRTANLTTGYCISINDANTAAAYTLENFTIGPAQAYADITLAGPPAISKGFRYLNNSANTTTLQNVIFTGLTANRGVTTPLSITTTNTTGVPRVYDSSFASTADATPVANNLVSFDSNGIPKQDSGVGSNVSVSGPTWGYCQGAVNATNAQELILFPFIGGATNNSCGTISAGLELIMPAACTAKSLFAKATAAGAVAGSGVIKVYKNTVAQALTCTLGTGTTCSDSTVGHQFSYAANDTIKITVTTGQATDTTSNVRAAIVCQ